MTCPGCLLRVCVISVCYLGRSPHVHSPEASSAAQEFRSLSSPFLLILLCKTHLFLRMVLFSQLRSHLRYSILCPAIDFFSCHCETHKTFCCFWPEPRPGPYLRIPLACSDSTCPLATINSFQVCALCHFDGKLGKASYTATVRTVLATKVKFKFLSPQHA